MNGTSCRQSAAVIAAVRDGRWPEGCDATLRKHARTCRACAGQVEMARAFLGMAATTRPESLPSPGILWWKAQLRRRQQAVERATLPLTVAEKAVWMVLLLSAAAVLLWQRAGLLAWLHGLLNSLDNGQAASLATSFGALWTSPLLLVALGSLAACVAACLAACFLLAGRDER